MQMVSRLLFPPQCALCGGRTDQDFSLCADCWRQTHFITGLVCNLCGTPLPGEITDGPQCCDDCITIARPWDKGRAALIYDGQARRLVLAFKHGDRPDLARTVAGWMVRAGHDLFAPGSVVVPVPLHWQRLFRRRYNQAALLAQAIAFRTGLVCSPDLLRRVRATPMLEGAGRDQRFAALQGAMQANPRTAGMIRERSVVLIDDVMTSGATLAAAAEACHAAGATTVSILVLARVTKTSYMDPIEHLY